jgi:hypothetical protein
VGSELTLADVAIWVDIERLLQVVPAGFIPAQEFASLATAYHRLRLRLEEPFSTFGK